MRDIFTAELTALGEDLVAMSRLVETAISSAGTALLTGDLSLAENVIADDHTIDAMEADLDERCVQLIAQQQPVARDLRIIVVGLRLSASLERMGDLARHLAEVARLRYPNKALPAELVPTFTAMHRAAVTVAQRATTAIDSLDLAVCADLEAEDDTLDALLSDVFALTTTEQSTLTSPQVVDATLCARYFERFGDHAVSVARRITYLVTGDVEEQHQH